MQYRAGKYQEAGASARQRRKWMIYSPIGGAPANINGWALGCRLNHRESTKLFWGNNHHSFFGTRVILSRFSQHFVWPPPAVKRGRHSSDRIIAVCGWWAYAVTSSRKWWRGECQCQSRYRGGISLPVHQNMYCMECEMVTAWNVIARIVTLIKSPTDAARASRNLHDDCGMSKISMSKLNWLSTLADEEAAWAFIELRRHDPLRKHQAYFNRRSRYQITAKWWSPWPVSGRLFYARAAWNAWHYKVKFCWEMKSSIAKSSQAKRQQRSLTSAILRPCDKHESNNNAHQNNPSSINIMASSNRQSICLSIISRGKAKMRREMSV